MNGRKATNPKSRIAAAFEVLRKQLFLQIAFEDKCIKKLFHEFLFVWEKLFHFTELGEQFFM